MTRWEYLSVDLGNTPTKEDDDYLLNMAGARGWELVAVLAPQRAIFKRPRPAATPQKVAATEPVSKDATSRPKGASR